MKSKGAGLTKSVLKPSGLERSRFGSEATLGTFFGKTVIPDECLRSRYQRRYGLVSQGIPLITAEKTTTPWVTKLGDRIEAVR